MPDDLDRLLRILDGFDGEVGDVSAAVTITKRETPVRVYAPHR